MKTEKYRGLRTGLMKSFNHDVSYGDNQSEGREGNRIRPLKQKRAVLVSLCKNSLSAGFERPWFKSYLWCKATGCGLYRVPMRRKMRLRLPDRGRKEREATRSWEHFRSHASRRHDPLKSTFPETTFFTHDLIFWLCTLEEHVRSPTCALHTAERGQRASVLFEIGIKCSRSVFFAVFQVATLWYPAPYLTALLSSVTVKSCKADVYV